MRTSYKWILCLVFTGIAGIFIAANADGTSFLFPDEINAYQFYLRNGLFGAVFEYWKFFIGRVSAVTLVMSEIAVIDALAPSPWLGTVIARAANHVMIIISFAVSARFFLPAMPRIVAYVLAVMAFAGAEIAAGIVPAIATFMLDQSIYFLLIASYALFLGFAWRFFSIGLTSWEEIGFLIVLFFYLNAHEINLVIGGFVLFLMLVACFVYPLRRSLPATAIGPGQGPGAMARAATEFTGFIPKLGTTIWSILKSSLLYLLSPLAVIRRRLSRWRRRSPMAVMAFFAVYAGSAYLQLKSPSFTNRMQTWPAKMSLFPDAFLAGLNGAMKIWERAIDIAPPYISIVLFVAVCFGIGYSSAEPGSWRRRLLFVIIVVCNFIGFGLVIATLAAYIGYLQPNSAVFPPHMEITISFFGAITMLAAGTMLGASVDVSTTLRGAARKLGWLALAPIAVLYLYSDTVRNSTAFIDGRYQLKYGAEQKYTKYNKWSLFWRFDRQLRAAPVKGKVYVDEWTIFNPDYSDTWKNFYQAAGTGIHAMYRVPEIVYIPCELGANPKGCNGVDGPVKRRTYNFTTPRDVANRWPENVGAVSREDETGVWLHEKPGNSEHYVMSTPFTASSETAIDVEVDILDRAAVRYVALYLIGPDGNAIQSFDLTKNKPFGKGEFGAKIVRPAVSVEGKGRRIEATFVSIGPGKSYRLRVQLLNDKGGSIYPGTATRGIKIGDIRIIQTD